MKVPEWLWGAVYGMAVAVVLHNVLGSPCC